MLGSLSCLKQRRGFDPPLRRMFLVEEVFFPLGNGFWLHFPQNSFRWDYKPRSRLSTYTFHRTDSKDPDIHVLDGWMPATKTHPACTILVDGIWQPQWFLKTKTKTKNGHIHKKKSSKLVNPEIQLRSVEEEEEEEEEEEVCWLVA